MTYNVFYRKRGAKNGQEFYTTCEGKNQKEVRKNFEYWDNENQEWTITKIVKVEI